MGRTVTTRQLYQVTKIEMSISKSKKLQSPIGHPLPRRVPCRELRAGQRQEPGDRTTGRKGRGLFTVQGLHLPLSLSQALGGEGRDSLWTIAEGWGWCG